MGTDVVHIGMSRCALACVCVRQRDRQMERVVQDGRLAFGGDGEGREGVCVCEGQLRTLGEGRSAVVGGHSDVKQE